MGTRAISFFALLVIAIITLGRYFTNRQNPLSKNSAQLTNRFHTAWAGWVLALVVAFATDIDDGMGAAFGVAVIIGLIASTITGKGFGNLLGAGNVPGTATGNEQSPTGGGGTGSNAPPCPAGQVRDSAGNCVPLLNHPSVN